MYQDTTGAIIFNNTLLIDPSVVFTLQAQEIDFTFGNNSVTGSTSSTLILENYPTTAPVDLGANSNAVAPTLSLTLADLNAIAPDFGSVTIVAPTGGSPATVSGSVTLNNPTTISGGLSINASQTLGIGNNDFSVGSLSEAGSAVLDASGQSSGKTVSIGGSATLVTSGYKKGSGAVVFTGTGTLTSAGNDLGLMTVSGTSSPMTTLTLGDNLTVSGTTGLTVSVGTVGFGSTTLTLSGLSVASGAVITQTASTVQFNTGTYSDLNGTPNMLGSVVINSAQTLTLGSNLIFSGNWTNTATPTTGTLTPASYTVSVGGSSGTTSIFTGNTSFYGLACTTAGKTLSFSSGVANTTIVTNTLNLLGATGGAGYFVTLTGSAGWYLTNTGATTVNANYLLVRNSNLTATITASNSKDLGGNNSYWVFSPNTLTWTGASGTNWNTPGNWSLGFVPNWTDTATIPATGGSVTNYPDISGVTTIKITILTINGNMTANTNPGTITVLGTLTVGSGASFGNATSVGNLTWVLGTNSVSVSSGLTSSIGNLTVTAGAGTVSLSSDIYITNLVLSSGSLAATTHTLYCAGSVSQTGGVVNFTQNAAGGTLNMNGGGTPTLDPTGSSLNHLTISGGVTVKLQQAAILGTGSGGGNLLVSSGTLDVNGYSLLMNGTQLEGTVTNSSGTAANFTAQTGTLVLQAPTSITTNNGNIQFNTTVDGPYNLSLTAGTGTVAFNAAVGSGTPVGSGTGAAITIGTGVTTFGSTVATANGVSITPNVTFDNDVALDGAGTGNTTTSFAGNVTFSKAGSALVFTAGRTVNFGTSCGQPGDAVDRRCIDNDGGGAQQRESGVQRQGGRSAESDSWDGWERGRWRSTPRWDR